MQPPFCARAPVSQNQQRFVALDSCRGICAVLVAIHNFGTWLPQLYGSTFIQNSALFVDFFFVLSGFVITHSYMHRITSRTDLGLFMLRRCGRLLPLHATMFACLFGLELLKLVMATWFAQPIEIPAYQDEYSLRTIPENLLLLQALNLHGRPTWNAPSWSISTEFWTYLLFAGICLFSPKRGPPVFFMALVAILAAAVVLLWSPAFLVTNSDYAIFRCIYGFFVGHLVYRVWAVSNRQIRTRGLVEISALVLAGGFVGLSSGIWTMAAPLLFGFVVWMFAHEAGPLEKTLRMRPLVQLGAWSYSIYMVHWLVGSVLFRVSKVASILFERYVVPSFVDTNLPWVSHIFRQLISLSSILDLTIVLSYLVVVITLSACTFEFIERPGRRFFNDLSERLR